MSGFSEVIQYAHVAPDKEAVHKLESKRQEVKDRMQVFISDKNFKYVTSDFSDIRKTFKEVTFDEFGEPVGQVV